MVVALVHVIAVVVGGGFFAYRAFRKRHPAERPVEEPRRRVRSVTLEGIATGLGIFAIVLSVILKLT